MQQHIHMLRCICKIMEGNVREAHKYAVKAHEMRQAQHKQTADWCVDMARGHLGFNSHGHSMVEKLMNELQSAEPMHVSHEVVALFAEYVADIKRDAAEVQAMLDAYNK